MVVIGSAEFILSADSAKLLQEMAKAEQATRKSAQAQAAAIAKASGASVADVKRATDTIIREQKRAAQEAEKAAQQIAKSQQQTSASFLSAAKSMGAFGAAALGVSVGAAALNAAITSVIENTRKQEQAQFAINALYGQAAPLITAQAEALAQSSGRSKTEALSAAAAVANLGRQYAFTGAQQQAVLKISADLAAIKGLTLEQATSRISDALRGEAEAAEYLGQVLGNDAVKAFAAMTAEQRRNFETLSPITKAQLTLGKLIEDNSNLTGTAAKRTETFTGSIDKLTGKIDDLSAALGKKLAPNAALAARETAGLVEKLTGIVERTDTDKIRQIGAAMLTIASPLALIRSLVTGDDSIARALIEIGRIGGALPAAVRRPTGPAEESGGAAEQGSAAIAQAATDAANRAKVASEARKDAIKAELEAAEKASKKRLEIELEAIDAEKKAKEAWYDEERTRIEARRTYQLEDIETRKDAALAAIKAEQEAAKEASELAIELAERRKASELAAVDEAADRLKQTIDAEKDRLETVRELEDRARDDERRKEDRELDEFREREDAEIKAAADALGKKRDQQDRAREDRRRKDDADRQQRRQDEDRELQEEREREDRRLAERAQALARRRQQEDRDRAERRTDEDRARADARAAEDDALEVSQKQRLAAVNAEYDARIQAIDGEIAALRERFEAEEDARERAHQAAMDALDEQSRAEDDRHRRAIKALEDEKDARLRAIDAELGLLDAADEAERQAAEDKQQQANITNKEYDLLRAQSTGNLSEIVKAEQELDEARAAIGQTAAKRERDVARDILRAKKQAIADEIDARKDAEDEANRIRERELDDARETAQRAYEAARNGFRLTFEAQVEELEKRKEAEQTAYDARLAQLQAEFEAEKKRIADRRLAEDRDRDDRRKAEDAERDDRRTKQDDQLAKDRQRLSDRRKDEDDDRADRRRKEDDALAASRLAQDRRRTDERTKEDEKLKEDQARLRQIRQDEDQSLTDRRTRQDRDREDYRTAEDKALAAQLAAAEVARETERRRVEVHYNGPNGVITQLKKAGEESDKEYSRRLAVATKAFEDERKVAERVYTNPEKNGLLDLLEKARKDEFDKLEKSKEDWGKWQKKISEDIKKAQEDLDAFIRTQPSPNSGGGFGSKPYGPADPGDLSKPPQNASELAARAAPAAQRAGLPVEVMAAIAGNESGFGDNASLLARKYHNWFGVKGSGDAGQTPPLHTWEVINGKRVEIMDRFAAYTSDEAAFEAFAKQFSTGRYQKAADAYRKSGNPVDYLQGIFDAGYATDPDWVKKIRAIGGFDRGHLFTRPTMTYTPSTGQKAWIAERRPELLVGGAQTASMMTPALSGTFGRSGYQFAASATPERMMGASMPGRSDRMVVDIALDSQTKERIVFEGIGLNVRRNKILEIRNQ